MGENTVRTDLLATRPSAVNAQHIGRGRIVEQEWKFARGFHAGRPGAVQGEGDDWQGFLGTFEHASGQSRNRETCISVTYCDMTCVKGTSGSAEFKRFKTFAIFAGALGYEVDVAGLSRRATRLCLEIMQSKLEAAERLPALHSPWELVTEVRARDVSSLTRQQCPSTVELVTFLSLAT